MEDCTVGVGRRVERCLACGGLIEESLSTFVAAAIGFATALWSQ